MSKMQFKLNGAGVRELMQSGEMVSVLESYADEIAARAGEGYNVHIGPTRANVSVVAETEEAAQDNYENNTLLKAVR